MTATIIELHAYDPRDPVERAAARALRMTGLPVTREGVLEVIRRAAAAYQAQPVEEA